jgi:hypothetical protein
MSMVKILIVGACALLATAGEAMGGSLIAEGGAVRTPPMMTNHPLVRTRDVAINLDELDALKTGVRSAVTFNLFDDVTLRGRVERTVTAPSGALGLTGRVEGDPYSAFTLIIGDHTCAASIRTSNGAYRIRFDADGAHAAQQLDMKAFPGCACGARHHVRAAAGPIAPPSRSADDGSTIDVMVVYSNQALAAVGSEQSMMTVIDTAILETNNAYANSGIDTRVRLVHAEHVSYNESGSFFIDLDRMTDKGDLYLEEVHTMRDAHRADLVVMLIDDMDYCGLGWLMTTLSPAFASYGFSVTNWECALTTLTFPHELGHNMGCHHDYANASGDGVFPYSHGHHFSFNGNTYRTVMAYPPGLRASYFSNPQVLFAGTVPTGVEQGEPDAADCALTINLTAYTVANFQESEDDPPPPCDLAVTQHPANASVCLGDSASFAVAASSDETIEYQWRLDGVDIDGAVSISYAIAEVTTDDLGVYDVWISNECDAFASNPATLSEGGGLTYFIQPTDTPGCEGQPITLSVDAGADPVSDTVGGTDRTGHIAGVMRGAYYRVFEPALLKRAEIYMDAVPDGRLVWFVYESRTVAGPYHLIAQAENATGAAGPRFHISPELNIALREDWEYLIGCGWPDEHTYYFGGSHPEDTSFGRTQDGFSAWFTDPLPAEFSNTTSSSYRFRLTTEPIGYQWFKNNQEIEDETRAALRIESAAPDDAGVYAVQVTGPCGPVMSDVAAVTVKDCACWCDFNKDAMVGLGDLNTLLSNWGPCPGEPEPCAWDFTLDAIVGLGDLNALLSNWGPCWNP